jgi:hypothetical protein
MDLKNSRFNHKHFYITILAHILRSPNFPRYNNDNVARDFIKPCGFSARYHQTPFNTPKGFDENLPKKIPVYVGSPITPFSVGAKATLKPSNPIKKNAEHVLMIFFNKLLVSSSPSSPISKRPTDIVTIKTKTPNIKTQEIVKVFPSQTCNLSTQVSGTQRLILSSIQDQPVRFSLPQSQRFFLNWDAAGF